MNKKERQAFLGLHRKITKLVKREKAKMVEAENEQKSAHASLYKHTHNRAVCCLKTLEKTITDSGNSLEDWIKEFEA